jgi:hypothetical protein
MTYEVWTDISINQNKYADNPLPIDFVKMRDAGVDGVCIRKSSGYYRDIAFEMNWAGAGDAGLKRTIYVVPYVGYGMERQWTAMTTLIVNGAVVPFEPTVDRPVWNDVEYRHRIAKTRAIEEILVYQYRLKNWSPKGAEFYTAKSVWERYYSSKPGWINDWGLVVANYRPELYGKSLAEIVAAAKLLTPIVPIGWVKDRDGNYVLPKSARWNGWQVAADGDGLGRALGVHSSAIDISLQVIASNGDLPPPASETVDVTMPINTARTMADALRGAGYE